MCHIVNGLEDTTAENVIDKNHIYHYRKQFPTSVNVWYGMIDKQLIN